MKIVQKKVAYKDKAVSALIAVWDLQNIIALFFFLDLVLFST